MLEKCLGLGAELDEMGSHGLDGGAKHRDVDGRRRRRGRGANENKLREERVDIFRGFEAFKSGDFVVKF